ncbi:MAG: UDP-N-acetylmuramate--L-alanine ligase [Spirochaetaceae bacterium]
MEKFQIPPDLTDFPVFFVGIKGTGMAALAELFLKRGAAVRGSDTEEKFYTDEVLDSLGISYYEGFNAENLPDRLELVVHSSAYDPQTHPELQEARRRKIPVLEYTGALGELSRTAFSVGVAGVHGKTTTTGLLGNICKEAELPASVLVGSAVSNFGNRSTFVGGDRYFIAETCEYRRHFLSFSPDIVVITNVDADHLDYFKDEEDVKSAFVEYGKLLSEGGTLIYCSDDAGAVDTAGRISEGRKDVRLVPYGFSAEGAYRIKDYRFEPGTHIFSLGRSGTAIESDTGKESDTLEELHLHIPGRHSVLNAAAAVAVAEILQDENGRGVTSGISRVNRGGEGGRASPGIRRGLETFTGSKRRSEILGEYGGVVFMDDYGHHPREIRSTLEGIREFYPDRRLIADFMSHTYSRTEAFLDDFSRAFSAADEVILHKIYSSAREREGRINGKSLFEEMKKHHPNVKYFHEVMEAEEYLSEHLRRGDLFLTLGAGDNWRIGEKLKNLFARKESI